VPLYPRGKRNVGLGDDDDSGILVGRQFSGEDGSVRRCVVAKVRHEVFAHFKHSP
jgi:hypothetical protein